MLADFLALMKLQAPHVTTYSRILGRAIQIDKFEQVVSDFISQHAQLDDIVVLVLDGKTMRGKIPADQSRGLHLLAAFLPDEDWVLMQLEVERREN